METLKKNFWKFVCIALLFYTVYEGLNGKVPRQAILNETVRNLYFHVTMWFTMIFLLGTSVYHSIQYLRKGDLQADTKSYAYVETGLVFALLGLVTGSFWAKFTWGDWWTNDPKLNSVAVGLLIYLAYLLVRSSLPDDQQKARISSVYNIFAFIVFMVLIWILPRMTDSLHPGNGGNPGFNSMDLDNRMRMVFYPAIIGWTMLGFWIANLRVRIKQIEQQIEEKE
ncbi:cytochrome c biogenesis protein CcsA [Aquirufa sp.]|jgi:heme exporter protein C|uniref:cytochrome c biogenesis protein CcsA n=1 Tax=Aquirufa sp. TaxID=2676249 RepID=UPI0037C0C2FB